MWSLEILSLFVRKILKASERLISWWTSMKKVICKNNKKEINTLLFNHCFFFFFKQRTASNSRWNYSHCLDSVV